MGAADVPPSSGPPHDPEAPGDRRSGWREWLDWLKDYVRRRAYYAFCITLVTLGLGVLALPVSELLIAIAVEVLGIEPPTVPPWRVWLEPLAALALIVTGVVLAERHRRYGDAGLPPPDGIKLTFPAACTFEQAARGIADDEEMPIRFEGFRPDELKTPLDVRAVSGRNGQEALRRLRNLAPKVRAYTVMEVDGVWVLETEGEK